MLVDEKAREVHKMSLARFIAEMPVGLRHLAASVLTDSSEVVRLLGALESKWCQQMEQAPAESSSRTLTVTGAPSVQYRMLYISATAAKPQFRLPENVADLYLQRAEHASGVSFPARGVDAVIQVEVAEPFPEAEVGPVPGTEALMFGLTDAVTTWVPRLWLQQAAARWRQWLRLRVNLELDRARLEAHVLLRTHRRRGDTHLAPLLNGAAGGGAVPGGPGGSRPGLRSPACGGECLAAFGSPCAVCAFDRFALPGAEADWQQRFNQWWLECVLLPLPRVWRRYAMPAVYRYLSKPNGSSDFVVPLNCPPSKTKECAAEAQCPCLVVAGVPTRSNSDAPSLLAEFAGLLAALTSVDDGASPIPEPLCFVAPSALDVNGPLFIAHRKLVEDPFARLLELRAKRNPTVKQAARNMWERSSRAGVWSDALGVAAFPPLAPSKGPRAKAEGLRSRSSRDNLAKDAAKGAKNSRTKLQAGVRGRAGAGGPAAAAAAEEGVAFAAEEELFETVLEVKQCEKADVFITLSNASVSALFIVLFLVRSACMLEVVKLWESCLEEGAVTQQALAALITRRWCSLEYASYVRSQSLEARDSDEESNSQGDTINNTRDFLAGRVLGKIPDHVCYPVHICHPDKSDILREREALSEREQRDREYLQASMKQGHGGIAGASAYMTAFPTSPVEEPTMVSPNICHDEDCSLFPHPPDCASCSEIATTCSGYDDLFLQAAAPLGRGIEVLWELATQMRNIRRLPYSEAVGHCHLAAAIAFEIWHDLVEIGGLKGLKLIEIGERRLFGLAMGDLVGDPHYIHRFKNKWNETIEQGGSSPTR
ncbi:hypothetical protein GNI_062160 [Gregarina niphandrodes]|uniref:Uncharacterized protein n=1 Tax=Gregarina niphandrodes TaxID=110365 RepID=A0A023B8A3_GRENI|nr:hypothetical protein GNI_062160 [Gregarina niphandrodes]EZG68465.1 hypothetical protein GNI_062160 [Gregarina niphandrodes]|eukprot:XP_011134570.1 hypothetical protein GNI_062160 [Gregarina niphandrodes]